MAQTDREKCIMLMRKKGNGLFPSSPIDAEMLDAIEAGKDVEVTLKQRRSLPQLRAYWAWLGEVVAATEAYPSAEHMHEALKFSMGYTTQIKTLAGHVVTVPDSIAFSKMDAVEFNGFFKRAVRLVAEALGVDIPIGRDRE
jgi:hypothetical protein